MPMLGDNKHTHLMTCGKKEVSVLVGNRIRLLRREKLMTIEELACLSSMEYSQLSRIELGKVCTSIFHVYKIANALNIKATELIECLN